MTKRDGAIVFVVAFVSRVVVVLWAAARFPAAADGLYYETLAHRLSEGLGYTWAWPDGAVTYAAHYPVGLPAMIAACYVVLGRSTAVAMVPGLLIGSVAAIAAHRILELTTTRKRALVGALAFALHPALLPYTGAIMTEGLVASLLVVAAWIVCEGEALGRARTFRSTFLRVALPLGLLFGVMTLVRPQSILFAPFFAVALPLVSPSRRIAMGVCVAVIAVAVCLPWTARNCVRMDRCALVSVNGGWNLLIGAQTRSGAWQEIETPEACSEVWSEAGKDACFEGEARKAIAGAPLAFASKVPAKLAVTFDYFGAAPWYFNTSNPHAFDEHAKTVLGAAETIATRLLLAAAFVLAIARVRGGRVPSAGARIPRRLRYAVFGIGLMGVFVVHAWLAVVTFGLGLVLEVFASADEESVPRLVPLAAVVVLGTALIHGVFFGAGRYGLPIVPFVTLLAFVGAASVKTRREALQAEDVRGRVAPVDAKQVIVGDAGA